MKIEAYKMRTMNKLPKKGLTGRRKIKTTVKDITAENVVDVLEKALTIHALNASEIDYLYRVYCGEQDIKDKRKLVRENINNKVVVNRANEIVSFETAFALEEPLQYISHGGNDSTSKLVNSLNEYMRAAGADAVNKSIVDWAKICGVSCKLALVSDDGDDAPFSVYFCDPRRAFVIYHDGIGEKPLAGVILGVDEDETTYADVYTKTEHFVVKGDKATKVSSPQYDEVPLVEYVNNEARIGAFEVVISLLNNINFLESNAVDSIQDFVNGFDVFQNCDIEDGTYKKLGLGGQAVKIKTVTQGMEAKVYRIFSEINQSGVQTRIDDMTDAIFEIVGMPNRNGGSSTSDTGTAVLFRDGWSDAASRLSGFITLFKRSEREFDKVILNICKVQGVDVPELADFEPEFPRGNLSNMQSKVQALCEMLNNPKIHPKYAFSLCGLFDDSEEAYRVSEEYYRSVQKEKEDDLNNEVERARAEALLQSRSNNPNAEQESDKAS